MDKSMGPGAGLCGFDTLLGHAGWAIMGKLLNLTCIEFGKLMGLKKKKGTQKQKKKILSMIMKRILNSRNVILTPGKYLKRELMTISPTYPAPKLNSYF